MTDSRGYRQTSLSGRAGHRLRNLTVLTTVSAAGCPSVGVNDFSLTKNILIYPNPVSDAAAVHFTSASAGAYTLDVSDLSGKTQLHTTGTAAAGASEYIIDFSSLSAGMYLVILRNDEGRQSARVVKE